MRQSWNRFRFEEAVKIDTGRGEIDGSLAIPETARGAVIFAHGSGSSRHSPRNQLVAQALHDAGLATLLIDLLAPEEQRRDATSGEHRFDIQLLAGRLRAATDWLAVNCEHHAFRMGYFGANTGAAAALVAAAEEPQIAAIVSRGGRPDLVGEALRQVRAATLLIVGGKDMTVLEINRTAFDGLILARNKELKVIPRATHLFEERGAMKEVARLASQWFIHYLGPAGLREPTYKRRVGDWRARRRTPHSDSLS